MGLVHLILQTDRPVKHTGQDVVDVEQHIQNLQRDDENIYY